MPLTNLTRQKTRGNGRIPLDMAALGGRLKVVRKMTMLLQAGHMCQVSPTGVQPWWAYVCFADVTLAIGLNAKGAGP